METGNFDMPRFLADTPLFSGLSKDELARIALNSLLTRQAKESLIFSVGDPCDYFYFVVTGLVKLFVVSPAGQEKVIEIISPGQSFAEALVFLDKPCILSAQALTDTVLIAVSKHGVFDEIERDPHFALHMLAGISRRMHGLIRDVEDYALRKGMQRLIGYLLRDVDTESLISEKTVNVLLPVSKATVASRLSLTPEYFSRVLHELVDEKLIKINRREICILDVQRLLKYGSPLGQRIN